MSGYDYDKFWDCKFGTYDELDEKDDYEEIYDCAKEHDAPFDCRECKDFKKQ